MVQTNMFPLQNLKEEKREKVQAGREPRAINSRVAARLIDLLKKLTANHKGTSFTGGQALVIFYYALGCLGHLH